MTARVFLMALLLCPMCAVTQPDRRMEEAQAQLEQTRRSAQSIVPQFRDSISAMLNASEREIEESTRILVTSSWEVQARATRDSSGRRVIRLNAGLANTLDWISTSMAAIAPKYPNCSHHFVNDLFTSGLPDLLYQLLLV
jgi:hypothetical protein